VPARLTTAFVVALLGLSAARARAQDPSPSRSIGSASRGRLQHGVRVRATPGVVLQGGGDGSGWATAELVALIARGAATLQARAPGPRLLVGALSQRRGGRFPPHSSHQNGRDADLGFALTDEDGHASEPSRFVDLDGGGCGVDRGTSYCIDPARTFQLFRALLEDPLVRVQWILVAPDIREIVLAAGRRMELEHGEYERVVIATETRGGSESHRSHFHVRIYCAPDDRPACLDEPPYQSWYDGEPPVPTRARSSRRRRRAARARRRRATRPGRR
jgi:penicillin-insensitive murein endopeptidase